MLVNDIATVEESLVVRRTTTPPPGAGVPSVIRKGRDWPKVGETDGNVIDPGVKTLTVTRDSAMSGSALIWTIDVPTATPVIGMTALLPPAGIVAVAGTPATPGLSDVILRLNGEGIADGRANIK